MSLTIFLNGFFQCHNFFLLAFVILLSYFRKGNNAEQAAKKLRDVYGEEALKEIPFWGFFTKR